MLSPTMPPVETTQDCPNNKFDTFIDVEMSNAEDNNSINVVTQPDPNSDDNHATQTTIPTPSDSNSDVVMDSPTTPTKGRRSKKTKVISSPPVTTPNKRGKASMALNPQPSPKHISNSNPPDTHSSDPSDDELEKMTKETLIGEVFHLANMTGHACSEEAFKSLSPSVLLARAKEYRLSLLAKVKQNTKKPGLIPIIKFDTPDHVIADLDSQKARSVFLSCLRKQNKKIERPKLDGMIIQDLKREIIKYRNSLLAKDMDFAIDDPSLESQTPSPSTDSQDSNDLTSEKQPQLQSDISATEQPQNEQVTSNTTKSQAHFVKEPTRPKSNQIIKPVPPPRTPKVQSTNINAYTSEKRGQSNSVFPQLLSENKTAGFNQTLISIRAKFYREFAKLSLSELARICISLVREVDGSMFVLA